MRKITFLSLIFSLFATSAFAQACMDTENDGDLSYTASVDGSGDNYLTVTPSAGYGDSTLLLFFIVDGVVSGANNVLSNPSYLVTSARQSMDGNVYFYYLYNVPSGGEKNTQDDNFSFPYGTCPTLSNESFSVNNFEKSLTVVNNPIQGKDIEVKGINQEVDIELYDLAGQLLSVSTTSANTHTIETAKTLTSGMYLVLVKTADGKKTKAKRVVVNN